MDSRLFIPLLLAGAVALACGSRSHSESAVGVATAAPTAPTTPVVHHRAQPRASRVNPEIKSAFAVSASPNALHFALNVTNPGKKGIELTFPSGQQYDFIVHDSVGREVYRWGKGRMFTQSLQNKVLDGGETQRFEEHASTKLAPGSYVAVATLRSSNYPVQERVSFVMR